MLNALTVDVEDYYHVSAFESVIRFADSHIVVVEKPAGLTTMRHAHEAAEFGSRGRRFLPPTLADLLDAAPDATSLNCCGQMGGVILVAESGEPLTNYLSWRDQRTSQPHSPGKSYLETLREEFRKRLHGEEQETTPSGEQNGPAQKKD